MAGVNDLAKRWGERANEVSGEKLRYEDHEYMRGRLQGRFDMLDECSYELDDIARTVWKPVSEPPTEADGDSECEVIALGRYIEGAPKVDCAEWWELPAWATHWARIQDVLLLPEGQEDA